MSLLAIILIIVALLLGAGIGIFAGISYRKNVAEKEIGSAEEEARKIVSEAMKTAEAKKKEYGLEGAKVYASRFTVSEPRAKKKLPTAAKKFNARKDAFSKRKKPSTKSLTTWSLRTKSFLVS